MDKKINRLLTKLTVAYTNFIKAASQLDPDKRQRAGVCGEWSPKEVVSHLIGWDHALKEFVIAPADFEPTGDLDEFNARSVAARKDLVWPQLIAELETEFQALEQALATLEPNMKIYGRATAWLQGRIEDYELHTRQLEAWLR